MPNSDTQGSAVISECGRYRYVLERWWGSGPRIAWVMLNPSTADADQDDPTIRRVMRFSREWGYDGCVIVNVYAYRATSPRDLASIEDKHGPEWVRYFGEIAESYPVVAAWGVHAGEDGKQLARVLTQRKSLFPTLCLGLTKDGYPRHPLYVRADTEPIPLARDQLGEKLADAFAAGAEVDVVAVVRVRDGGDEDGWYFARTFGDEAALEDMLEQARHRVAMWPFDPTHVRYAPEQIGGGS